MNRALGQYANQLANKGQHGGAEISRQSNIKSLTGTVSGFGVIPSNTQQPNQWVFMVDGDGRTFTIGRETYAKIPMVKEGDLVSFSYLEVAGNELAVSTFTCKRGTGTRRSMAKMTMASRARMRRQRRTPQQHRLAKSPQRR